MESHFLRVAFFGIKLCLIDDLPSALHLHQVVSCVLSVNNKLQKKFTLLGAFKKIADYLFYQSRFSI